MRYLDSEVAYLDDRHNLILVKGVDPAGDLKLVVTIIFVDNFIHASRNSQCPGMLLSLSFWVLLTLSPGWPGQYLGLLPEMNIIWSCRERKAGNQCGVTFWDMLLGEHGLDKSGVSIRVMVARMNVRSYALDSNTRITKDQTPTTRAGKWAFFKIEWWSSYDAFPEGVYVLPWSRIQRTSYEICPRSVQIDLEAGVFTGYVILHMICK